MIPATDRMAATDLGGDGATATGVRTVEVLGVPVCATSLEIALDAIDEWVVTGAHCYACTADLGGLVANQDDESLRRALRDARLVLPSGRLLAWYSRRKGAAGAESYSARELLLGCCRRSIAGRYRHFFYGPTQAAVERLVTGLKKRLPDIVIAGVGAPGSSSMDGEDTETERRIEELEPDIVWVGLGTPREECWMANQIARGSRTVMVGMGLACEAGRPRVAGWLSLCRAWQLTRRHAAGAPAMDLGVGSGGGDQ